MSFPGTGLRRVPAGPSPRRSRRAQDPAGSRGPRGWRLRHPNRAMGTCTAMSVTTRAACSAPARAYSPAESAVSAGSLPRCLVTSTASWARVAMSSLANMCARWVCTVRRDMYSRSPIWGLDSPSATRPATACPAAAAPDARLAQCGFGAGHVTGGAEPLVDAERLIEERAGAVQAALPREGGARVLAGKREPQGTRPARAGASGGLQDLGVVLDQAPAAQRGAGHPGHLVACRYLGDRRRGIPGPSHITRGQREPDKIGPDGRVI